MQDAVSDVGTISHEEQAEIEAALEPAVADEKAGRVKSMEQVIKEARAKFGFSEQLPFNQADRKQKESDNGASR